MLVVYPYKKMLENFSSLILLIFYWMTSGSDNTCLALQTAKLTFFDAIENLQSWLSALNSMITHDNLDDEDDDLNIEHM